MRKIPRKFAKISIICFVLGIAMFLLFVGFKNIIFVGVGIGFMYVSILIKMQLLKCPYCGFKGFMPSWAKINIIKCKNCNESFSYDN